MIFSQIDRTTLSTLTTLVKVAGSSDKYTESIIATGQHMGVPKDEIIEILTEWEEDDVVDLKTVEEKQRFVRECFSYLKNFEAPKSEKVLYQHVIRSLGLDSLSAN